MVSQNLVTSQPLFGIPFTGSLFNSVYNSKPSPSCVTASLGGPMLYLRSACTLVSSLPARASLRSSAHGLLIVPRMRSATAQSKCFAYAGPSDWNCLPLSLRLELLAFSPSQFRRRLKTFLFAGSSAVADRERH